MRKRFLIASGMTLACYFVFLFFSPLYDSSDSMMAAIVTDGLFGENTLSQFQHPISCVFIGLLSRIFPSADLFSVTVHVMVGAGIFCVVYFGLQSISDIPIRSWNLENYALVLILLLSVFFLSAGVNIWNCNYTITAGALVFMGFFLLSLREKRSGGWVAGTVLVTCGFMLRRESGMLFLPFVGLELLFSFMEKTDRKADILRRYLPCLLVIALLLGSREVLYSIEPYKTASRYNAARTAIMDFPMKSADTVADIVNPIDYAAALDWTFADTEVMDADLLERIATAGEKNKYSLDRTGFLSVLREMRHTLFHTNLYMLLLVIITVLLLLRNLLCCGGVWRTESLLTVAGASLILMYFTFRGRAPMRVWEPVLFAADMTLIQAACSKKASKKNPSREITNTVFLILLAVILWFSAGQVMAHAKKNETVHTALTARVNIDDKEYEASFDSLFIWPNWHGTVPRFFEEKETLPSQRVIDHNIALGDWTYGQPYFTEFLKRIGAENPFQLLLEGKAYIMGNGAEKYLQLHYGEDIRLVATEIVIDGRTAYRVERSSTDD